jgi:hypothetical protein
MTIVASTPIVFATGSPTTNPPTTAPDSITIGGGSIWVEYGNMGDSTGAVGSPLSTIVQYSMTGVQEPLISTITPLDNFGLVTLHV